jgi:hypothetical protein
MRPPLSVISQIHFPCTILIEYNNPVLGVGCRNYQYFETRDLAMDFVVFMMHQGNSILRIEETSLGKDK